MTDSIDIALVQQYSAEVHLAAQQKKSRLRGSKAVIERFVTGKDFYYDGLGDSEAIEVTTRHQDTIAQDIAHNRRRGTIRHFTHTFLLDKNDKLEVLIDPQSEYAMATARALYRQYDRLVIEAATAAVKTGRYGENTVSAASDGVLTVVHGGVGLTFDKLLKVNENFGGNEIGGDEDEEFYTLISSQQNTNLMGEAKLTSRDYRDDYVISGGKMRRAAGHNFIHYGGLVSSPMLSKVSTTRTCLSLAERAICMGIVADLEVDISRRPDKNNAIQVQATMYMNAIRTEGVRVQKLEATET